jgi:hypothetical protein
VQRIARVGRKGLFVSFSACGALFLLFDCMQVLVWWMRVGVCMVCPFAPFVNKFKDGQEVDFMLKWERMF